MRGPNVRNFIEGGGLMDNIIFGKNSVLEALISGEREINKIIFQRICTVMLNSLKLRN